MVAVFDGLSSCGSINMVQIDHHIPLPCVGDPTAASHVSPGSSPACSDASEGAAASHPEPDPGNEPEASAGRSTPMLRRDDGDTSSFFKLQKEQEQGRLPRRRCFEKLSSTPRNIRLQTPRHLCLLERTVSNQGKRMGAIDAVNEWRLPKASEEEDEAVDQKDWQAETLSSRIFSACDSNLESDTTYEGSNHDGRAFDNSDVEDCAAAVQRMERRFRGSLMEPRENISQAKLVAWKDAQAAKLIDKLNGKEAQLDQNLICVGAIDAVNEWRLPKVSEEEDDAVDQKDWQDGTLPSRISSECRRSWRRRELKP